MEMRSMPLLFVGVVCPSLIKSALMALQCFMRILGLIGNQGYVTPCKEGYRCYVPTHQIPNLDVVLRNPTQ
jgi:hypothetical protein